MDLDMLLDKYSLLIDLILEDVKWVNIQPSFPKGNILIAQLELLHC
jgi:hypothetical protein